ncbi:IPT/TIG domain-containing protein [Parasphingorhabdus sp.]|uniref:IPT/TIG domain-containing protein n=1 Tax=Parasphingorhabdus sp. TaxID=2709688 RepID=UPI003C721B23
MASNPITAESVIPISSIFDALEGVLTEAERQALLSQLTDLRAEGVAPGDLITAGMFNEIMSDINDLKVRMAGLEAGSSALVLSAISPPGDIEVNSLVTLTGVNFNREPRRNVVVVGNVAVTNFRSGSETSLSFAMPNTLSGLPATFDVVVETGGQRSNALPVTVVAEPREQAGNFEFATVSTPDGTMIGGATVSFTWDITANTTLDDSLTLQLSVGSPAGASESQWRQNLQFEPPSPLVIAAGATRRVVATIFTPASATAADLALLVTGIDGTTRNTSNPVQWRAGQALEVSSSNAIIDFSLPGDDGSGSSDFNEVANMDVSGISFRGVRVRRGSEAFITLELIDQRGGTARANYNFAVRTESNDSDWSVTLGPLPPSVTDVPPGEDREFNIQLRNNSGAAGEITFLRIEATQTRETATLDQFTSFITIPLQLF